MVTTVPTRRPARSSRRALPLAAQAGASSFLVVAAGLSIANVHALHGWGWTPLDHAGVPWPSALALVPGGWLQCLSFAATGAALIALAAALPRGGRAVALAVSGLGLVAAGFPLDLPVGDPSSLGSWIGSWHAVVHAAGFALAGLGGLAAVAASRRRRDVALAVLLAGAAVAGTPGWYAFVVGFFAWVWLLAQHTVTER